MIFGFFGKGGSGKTTTSFRCAQSIEAIADRILAVDADHNMDLAYNFGIRVPIRFLGADVTTGKVSIDEDEYRISSGDVFHETYVHPITSKTSLLVAGPHTEPIFRGDLCSHGLLKPIIVYLSRLRLEKGEYVMVDATAGMDSIGAGLPACLDVGVVCVEPTIHSQKVALQLIDGLDQLGTPSVVVANKVQTQEQLVQLQRFFPKKTVMPIWFHAMHADPTNQLSDVDRQSYRMIIDAAQRERGRYN